jgi:hypothetical protein
VKDEVGKGSLLKMAFKITTTIEELGGSGKTCALVLKVGTISRLVVITSIVPGSIIGGG